VLHGQQGQECAHND